MAVSAARSAASRGGALEKASCVASAAAHRGISALFIGGAHLGGGAQHQQHPRASAHQWRRWRSAAARRLIIGVTSAPHQRQLIALSAARASHRGNISLGGAASRIGAAYSAVLIAAGGWRRRHRIARLIGGSAWPLCAARRRNGAARSAWRSAALGISSSRHKRRRLVGARSAAARLGASQRRRSSSSRVARRSASHRSALSWRSASSLSRVQAASASSAASALARHRVMSAAAAAARRSLAHRLASSSARLIAHRVA